MYFIFSSNVFQVRITLKKCMKSKQNVENSELGVRKSCKQNIILQNYFYVHMHRKKHTGLTLSLGFIKLRPTLHTNNTWLTITITPLRHFSSFTTFYYILGHFLISYDISWFHDIYFSRRFSRSREWGWLKQVR